MNFFGSRLLAALLALPLLAACGAPADDGAQTESTNEALLCRGPDGVPFTCGNPPVTALAANCTSEGSVTWLATEPPRCAGSQHASAQDCIDYAKFIAKATAVGCTTPTQVTYEAGYKPPLMIVGKDYIARCPHGVFPDLELPDGALSCTSLHGTAPNTQLISWNVKDVNEPSGCHLVSCLSPILAPIPPGYCGAIGGLCH
jgi:hypothetical protein